MSGPADIDDDWAREIARLLLRRVGYAAAAQVLEEEAGTEPDKSARRRVRSHRQRAELAATELDRARARRIVGDD